MRTKQQLGGEAGAHGVMGLMPAGPHSNTQHSMCLYPRVPSKHASLQVGVRAYSTAVMADSYGGQSSPAGATFSASPAGSAPVPSAPDKSPSSDQQSNETPAQPALTSSSEPPAGQASASHDADKESSALNYQELYESIKQKPCRVEHLVRGYEERGEQLRTKPHLIDRELQRILDARNLEEIHTALVEAGERLQQLGVFNHVDFLANETPEDAPDACTVLLELKEKNWYQAHAATYFQGGENSVEIGAGLQNLTGHAEKISVAADYGTQKSSTFSLIYEQPRPRGLPLVVDARIQQLLRNHVKNSSFSEKLRGITLGLHSLNGQHSLQYELGWRSVLVDAVDTAVSRSVAAQAGDFLKGAARYTWFYDQRNNPVMPTRGWALRSSSELSGLWLDQSMRYAKQQLDAQLLLPITRHVTLNLTASTGVLLPWGGQQPLSRTTCIADRFFLGGPSSLRGFKHQGVGPMEERSLGRQAPDDRQEADAPVVKKDTLGGDLYASMMAEVVFSLPHKAIQALNLHGHLFVNGGNCDLLAGRGQPLVPSIKQWTSQWRWSAGAGVVLPTRFGRFEANYVQVLSAQANDQVKHGLQLGFATSIFS